MNKKMRIIYLEDTIDSTTEAFRAALASDQIDIELKEIAEFEKSRSEILEDKTIDGLIIDLKLDENAENANYTAPPLAQAFRSKYAEIAKTGSRIDIPIILFSTDSKIDDLYAYDSTSHDLFDFRMSKTSSEKYPLYSRRLFAITNGYKQINNIQGDIDVNQLLNYNIKGLEPRIFEDCEIIPNLPAYEYAKRILRGLLFYDSYLIDDNILAARLGIDKDASQDWNRIKELYSDAKYNGIFSEGWERWWMPEVNNIFKKISGGKSLSNLKASDRVLYYTEYSNITPATLIEKSESTRFWTICRCYMKPLDPREGFRIIRRNRMPWHDSQYISLEAALTRDYKTKNLIIEPTELARLKAIKDELK